MALQWESPCLGAELTLAGPLAPSTTPPSMNTYATITTPLILPRDWSDHYYLPSTSDPLCDNYDFQSNHLEASCLPSEIIPSLTGLGIKNLDMDQDTGNKDIKLSPNALKGLCSTQVHEPRRHNNRNYRTESIYDASGGYEERLQHHSNFASGLNSPWSFSAILSATELSTTSATFQSESCLTLVPEIDASTITSQLLNGSQLLDDGDEGTHWSFEKLSAATGLSVADFAAQISATAETTLRRMRANLNVELEGATSHLQDFPAYSFPRIKEPMPWPVVTEAMSSGLPLPLADISMRSLDLNWDIPNCVGVNPADILPNSQDILPAPQSPLSSGDPSIADVNNVSSQADYLREFKFDLNQSISKGDPDTPYQGPYSLPTLSHPCQNSHPGSDDDAFQSPSSSEHSPFLQPLGAKRNRAKTLQNVVQNTQNRDPETPSLEYAKESDQQNLPPINLGTPVFDAHRGIHIEELKAKAERYRLRNQGREYDKRWLISFAGKLTVKGELLDEFRCYVAGCKQVNKRRDHILIHVGAHLDQRPFKCMHCTARFLRKNECKRHELSHTGIRPFSCHLCPLPATTFVRQDLLKRHMKRTHRQELKSSKENEEFVRPKKRARARY